MPVLHIRVLSYGRSPRELGTSLPSESDNYLYKPKVHDSFIKLDVRTCLRVDFSKILAKTVGRIMSEKQIFSPFSRFFGESETCLTPLSETDQYDGNQFKNNFVK